MQQSNLSDQAKERVVFYLFMIASSFSPVFQRGCSTAQSEYVGKSNMVFTFLLRGVRGVHEHLACSRLTDCAPDE